MVPPAKLDQCGDGAGHHSALGAACRRVSRGQQTQHQVERAAREWLPTRDAARRAGPKTALGCDLSAFVQKHSTGPTRAGPSVNPATADQHLLDYVTSLWPILQQAETSVPAYSTLQPLPYPYVVPGGRFHEVYYWDREFLGRARARGKSQGFHGFRGSGRRRFMAAPV